MTDAVTRPQPLGIFGLPLGYLLIPASADEVRASLLAGRLPESWPAPTRVHQLVHAGELDAAAALLDDAIAADPGDVVARFNRFVLDPDSVDPDRLRADLGADHGVLVDLLRYSLDRCETPPEVGAATGEVAALVLAARATAATEPRGPGESDDSPPDLDEVAVAIDLLTAAIEAARPVSPLLAGLLHGARAEATHRAHGAGPEVVADFTEALRVVDPTDLEVARAELHLGLGSTHQELGVDKPHLLRDAVRHYHVALTVISPSTTPDLYAAAHANLATAYLTMPMTQASDQLRRGVAVRSLRAALTVFRPETHPHRWASTQLNLANALVYAPSTHQGDNLVEAVELYEAVIAARDPGVDPLGLARALANQGNALAHLGIFDQAKAKLNEARALFSDGGHAHAVRDVNDLLDEIARHAARRGAGVDSTDD